MPAFRTLDELDVADKRVLVRTDLNVPVKDGRVTDTTRIDRTAATLRELAEKRARVVVLAHFGRPDGKVVPSMSLRPVVASLAAALGRPVTFAEDCIGPVAESVVAALKPGDVALLENLRFHAEEEADDAAFAKQLAALGDIYVNDAFSAAHRAHASTAALAKLLPSAAGRLMQAELEHLTQALEKPQRPVAALVGGAKVSTKIDLLRNLVAKVEVLIVGGGMANTFLAARGLEIGASLAERDMADTARAIEKAAAKRDCAIILPADAVIAAKLEADAASRVADVKAVPKDQMILDVGPATIGQITQRLESCRTLVWNGPLGAFETPPFDRATVVVAQAAAKLTEAGKLLSVAGGGDTVAALAHAGVVDKFSYVSTAGGAFLEWLEGKDLPGVKALQP
ncbi:MAG TPA: phosphoglycerate kinase [Methylomirabilota bacterium]|nr:phosphoglycerate kinase [Methylomirabilota bacterium]